MYRRCKSLKRQLKLGRFELLEDRRVLATEGEVITIERTLDTSAMSGNISGTISWNDGTTSPAQIISQPSVGPLKIRFDYSLDSSGFFANQSRRDLLQLAADTLITKFADNLTAISPGGVNQWTASFQHPASGQMTSVQNLNIAANEILIYVGARVLTGNTLGLASIGGYSANGTQAFLDTIRARGQSGALLSAPIDFGPWGGAIAFQSNTNWHFGTTTLGLDSNESDFLSAAIHELCHVLGFGTAPSWATNLSGTQFTGNNSKVKYDLGGNVPTDSIRVHWSEGTNDGGQETLMDPTLTKGVRKSLTRLDLAGLQDIGWTLIEPTVTVRGTHTFADNGAFDIDVQLIGARTGTAGWSQNLNISNAAPTLAAIGNFDVLVGTPLVVPKLGVFSDLGFDNPQDSPPTREHFTYDIQWGDGSAPQSGNANVEFMGRPGTATTGFFAGSHVYSTSGTYNAIARITDDDGGTTTRSFSVVVRGNPQLSLSVSRNAVSENAGLRATLLTIRRTGGTPGPLTVNLSSSDTSELRLPLTTTIPAGSNEVVVDVEAVDDALLDGNVLVTLSASAVGFSNGSVQVEVSDHETLTGTISHTVVNEDAGTGLLTWNIIRSNSDNNSPLVLELSSSDATEIMVPATITIPAGQPNVIVPMVVVDDTLLDGTISVHLEAKAIGYRSSLATVAVQDVESLQLIVDRGQLQEQTPADTVRGRINLSFPAPSGGYTVQLTPSISGQITLPSSVTVPEGQREIGFDLVAIDDYAVEGALALQLLASGTGLPPAAVDLLIQDDDQPLWQNPLDKWDTDGNTFFNAMDALVVINNLNRFGSRYLRPGIDAPPRPFVDANGDGLLNAMDALVVINELNRRFRV